MFSRCYSVFRQTFLEEYLKIGHDFLQHLFQYMNYRNYNIERDITYAVASLVTRIMTQ